MIGRLALGAARVLFGLGVVVLALGVGLVYASWRLVRSAVADSPTPVRDASFAVLLALAGLRRALADRAVQDQDQLADEDAEQEQDRQDAGLVHNGGFPGRVDTETDDREPLIPY